MWDAVVPLVSPENVSETMFNVFAVESIMISPEPVPGDAVGGDSAGPHQWAGAAQSVARHVGLRSGKSSCAGLRGTLQA